MPGIEPQHVVLRDDNGVASGNEAFDLAAGVDAGVVHDDILRTLSLRKPQLRRAGSVRQGRPRRINPPLYTDSTFGLRAPLEPLARLTMIIRRDSGVIEEGPGR